MDQRSDFEDKLSAGFVIQFSVSNRGLKLQVALLGGASSIGGILGCVSIVILGHVIAVSIDCKRKIYELYK